MSTSFHLLRRDTRGYCDMHDLTADVEACIDESGISEGMVVVSVPGSTVGLGSLTSWTIISLSTGTASNRPSNGCSSR